MLLSVFLESPLECKTKKNNPKCDLYSSPHKNSLGLLGVSKLTYKNIYDILNQKYYHQI